MADLNLQRLGQAPSVEQFEMFFKKQIRVGEERLMMAVLESAVDNYQKYIVTGETRFEEAANWLFIDRDSRAFCSFKNICEILELNPGYVRQGLLRWKKEALKTHAGNGKPPKSRKLVKHGAGDEIRDCRRGQSHRSRESV